MENCMKHRKNNIMQKLDKCLAEDRGKIVLFFSYAVGIIMGSVTCAIYGSDWVNSGTMYQYFTNPTGTAIHLVSVTVGFILILLILGLFRVTCILIYPAVCFRGLGLGALTCGILQIGGTMGLCFTALTVLPYAVINSALAVYAGEFSLGIRKAFGKNNSALAKGLLLHTLKIFILYIIIAAASCLLFVGSCYAFGKYLI